MTEPVAHPAEPLPTPSRPESFDTVYRRERDRLVRVAHLITRSNGVAEELVHDVFLAAYRKWETINDPSAYLYRAVVNRSRSALRRLRLDVKHTSDVDPVVLPPEIDVVWEALAAIPTRRRTALVLRYYAGMTVPEIARVMGSRPSTVRSLVHRGYQSLRKELEGD